MVVVVCRFYIVDEWGKSKWNGLMQYFFYSALPSLFGVLEGYKQNCYKYGFVS